MRLHRQTWTALVVSLLALLAANLWCWRPGIGGGGSGRPIGTEVELYYGWPATYRAEWWRSEDPTLREALVRQAPFFHPAGAMELRARYVGLLPTVANAAFGLAVLIVAGLWTEALARRAWRRDAVAGLVLAAMVIAVVYLAADDISEHL